MVCALDYHGRKLRTRFSLLELANCIAHICSETKAKIRTFALLLHFPLICTSQHVLDPNTLGCAGECSTMALLLKWQYYPPPPPPSQKKKQKKKTKKKKTNRHQWCRRLCNKTKKKQKIAMRKVPGQKTSLISISSDCWDHKQVLPVFPRPQLLPN